MACFDNLVAGIFSREDSSTYEWLTKIVTCTGGVKDVRPVLITNNWNDFAKEVPKCSFAILYHSKSRGRLNITDVTDSLYDNELQHLSLKYGPENVVVVVGDLGDSSDEMKDTLLREQPSIVLYARDLFLFSVMSADNASFQGRRRNDLQQCIRRTARRELFKKSLIWLVFLAAAVLIVIIVVSVRASHHPENPSTLPPRHNVTHVTSHPIASMVTTPPSTTASQRMKVTSLLVSKITSAGNGSNVP